MSWLEFFSSVISSLAWPAAAVAIVIVLRKSLRQLLLNLKRVKGWGGEAEFGERVETAEAVFDQQVEIGQAVDEAVEPLQSPPRDRPGEQEPLPGPSGLPALYTELADTIRTNPRAAVIEAWLALEEELEELAAVAGVDLSPRRRTPRALQRELVNRGVIDSDLSFVISELKQARDIAVHTRPYTVDREDVIEYVKLAGRLRDELHSRLRHLDPARVDASNPADSG